MHNDVRSCEVAVLDKRIINTELGLHNQLLSLYSWLLNADAAKSCLNKQVSVAKGRRTPSWQVEERLRGRARRVADESRYVPPNERVCSAQPQPAFVVVGLLAQESRSYRRRASVVMLLRLALTQSRSSYGVAAMKRSSFDDATIGF
jgi:hypothetical protein